MGRSDLVRRAMSKKKAYVMEQERKNFVYGNEDEGVPGCQANGISSEVADQIYGTMMDFARYAFNKSHAACYAVVAMQTAWLKAYYPLEYWAAVLSSVYSDANKLQHYLSEMKREGHTLLTPDINASGSDFTVKDGKISFSLCGVKNVGKGVVDAVVNERGRRGNFKNLKDFADRCVSLGLSESAFRSLIYAGAFDNFGNRASCLACYKDLIEGAAGERGRLKGQLTLFNSEPELVFKMPVVDELPDKLCYEKEYAGVYISGHPLDEYAELLSNTRLTKACEIFNDTATDDGTISVVTEGQSCVIGGIIRDTKVVVSNNKKICFLTFEDMTGSCDAVVFEKEYKKLSQSLTEGALVWLKGKVSFRNDTASVVVENVVSMKKGSVPEAFFSGGTGTESETKEIRSVWVRFKNMGLYTFLGSSLESLCSAGRDSLIIYIEGERCYKRIDACCDASDKLFTQKLASLVGASNMFVE